MTKNTLKSLVAYLNGQTIDNFEEVKASLEAELAKSEEKAQANRALYAQAHDVVMAQMDETPKTIAELYDACKDALPEGMSKSKVQYALLNYWASEVVKANDGKVNTYAKA